MEILIGTETVLGDGRLGVIAGPCVAEDEGLCLEVAAELRRISARLGLAIVFKTSYAKENRTAEASYRGPGLTAGLALLARVRERTGLAVTADIHESAEVAAAAAVLDLLQIPAFLCRQTPLLSAAGAAGLPVNVKKGQFMPPAGMRGAVDKLRAAGCRAVLLTERGTMFGYGDLVVDMRSFQIMRGLADLTVFDMTHSLQRPGGPITGGDRAFAATLARAAVAAGADCVFLETHPEPQRALSDAATQLPLDQVESLLADLARLKTGVAALAGGVALGSGMAPADEAALGGGAAPASPASREGP